MLSLRFVRGLSPVAASGGHSSSRCAGLSLSRALLLRSTGSRRAGSVVVAHGPSRSTACGIFPDQGSNPCPLHWQADSQPLRHQGSPQYINLLKISLNQGPSYLRYLSTKMHRFWNDYLLFHIIWLLLDMSLLNGGEHVDWACCCVPFLHLLMKWIQ